MLLSAAMALTGCSSSPTQGAGPPAEATPARSAAGWFGGYLDVTLPPGPALQHDASRGATTVLAFITADPSQPCTPAWGGTLGMEAAGSQLQLDTQIRQARAAGGNIAVSFGGHRGQELATTCREASALADAYGAVIDRYALDVVDLDIEGRAAEPAADQRRAEAMARLQERRPKDRPLRIWLTLPVRRDGLDEGGRRSIEAMLAAGVTLEGVNLMTMNFGRLGDGETMLSASTGAAEATHHYLEQLPFKAEGSRDAAKLWRSLGLTPMIGDNDVEGNTFSLQDAAGLNAFAADRGLGRLSFWSINRDTYCPWEAQENVERPSSGCSGVSQDAGDFAKELGKGFTGGS
ncbi:chitinase [Pseudarthrobacter sp. NPDC058119]|uniref:chitinase n=1 Tax=Pseudarthrobacter sp. NPDC058119 TaxID=3346348 RepID=UPI0036D984A5